MRDIVWSKAEAVVWLDYSFPRVFWQLTHRTFRRWWQQEELWNGNRESIWTHFQYLLNLIARRVNPSAASRIKPTAASNASRLN